MMDDRLQGTLRVRLVPSGEDRSPRVEIAVVGGEGNSPHVTYVLPKMSFEDQVDMKDWTVSVPVAAAANQG